MKYKKLGGLDWFIIALGIVIIVMVLNVLVGCSTVKKFSDVKIVWHDGNCLLYAEGLSAEQATDIQKRWEFRDCEVIVNDFEGKQSKTKVLPKE
jgi:hypothetical protein